MDEQINPQSAQVHVVGVFVWKYDGLSSLEGPKRDRTLFEEMFSQQGRLKIGLHRPGSMRIFENPARDAVASYISDFVGKKTPRGDYFLFYFSGHGCVLPGSEFAFCLKDAKKSANGGSIVPASVLRLGDVVDSLRMAECYPILVIDACFAGAAVNQIDPDDIPDHIFKTNFKKGGTRYELLCSCSAIDPAVDKPDGGVFTRAIHAVAAKGIKGNDELLTAHQLQERASRQLIRIGHPVPRYYNDSTRLLVCRNLAFQEQKERFAPYMANIVRYAWNGGEPRQITIELIRKRLGMGAYGNHNKLKLDPWALLENGTKSRSRRLTNRGKSFASGALKIPLEIVKSGDKWVEKRNTKYVGINNFTTE